MTVSKLPAWMMVILSCVVLVGQSLAHGSGEMDFGSDSHGGEEAPSTSPPEPYEDPLSFWPFTLLQNESPEKVEARRQKLLADMEQARREGRSDSGALETRLRNLEIELEIARKRRDRDTMRKDGRREQAVVLDDEIHELKRKLEAVAGS